MKYKGFFKRRFFSCTYSENSKEQNPLRIYEYFTMLETANENRKSSEINGLEMTTQWLLLLLYLPQAFPCQSQETSRTHKNHLKHFPVSSNPNSNKKLVGVGIKFRRIMKCKFLKYGDWLPATLLCF